MKIFVFGIKSYNTTAFHIITFKDHGLDQSNFHTALIFAAIHLLITAMMIHDFAHCCVADMLYKS